MDRLLLGTGNPGKAFELEALLAPLGVASWRLEDLRPRPPLPEESGATLRDNAILKADHYARAAGSTALADDSGLEVDALGGAPGVRSARFAGPHATDSENLAKLFESLRDTPDHARTARFRCVLAVATPDGRHLTVEGSCEGRILREPRGFGGFGYDPAFFHDGLGCTFAQASTEAKSGVSHRAEALKRLLAVLPRWLADE